MIRIYITDYITSPDIEQNIFGSSVNIECGNTENENDFPNSIEAADALLVWHAKITKKTIDRLKNCKIIVRYGTGYENVDFQYAREKGIPFCNTPDYGIDEVADTACSMILALTRKIFTYNYSAQNYQSGWQEHTLKPISRSNKHKLGIIGIGRIGSTVALRMKAFGMDIGFYDPYVVSGYEKTLGVKRFDTIDELLKHASIISIHTPLTEETNGMVDRKFIDQLNPNTIFVNTARGKIVSNLNALYDGLKNGQLEGVGLDVLPTEPPVDSEYLIQAWKNEDSDLYSKIIITPHTAYYSDLAWVEMRSKTAENANRVLHGGTPKNLIVE
ncbi:MAG: C-terminal binding protein [bacterium]|nr:C-terminal binding protein [bacterium]